MSEIKWFNRDGSEAEKAPTTIGKSGTHGHYYEDHACQRCGGEGGFKGWPGYTCYRCGGATRRVNGRYLDPNPYKVRVYTEDHLARLNASQAKRDAKAAAKAKAEREARESEARSLYPEAIEILEGLLPLDEDRYDLTFVERMAQKWDWDRFITEGIAKAVVKAVEDEKVREAEAAKAEDCPTGRVEIEGEVLSLKWQRGNYGDTYKMLVKDARGFKVWGTVPSSIDPEVGQEVSFTATVEPSKDDAKFGFYKRPTQAVVV